MKKNEEEKAAEAVNEKRRMADSRTKLLSRIRVVMSHYLFRLDSVSDSCLMHTHTRDTNTKRERKEKRRQSRSTGKEAAYCLLAQLFK